MRQNSLDDQTADVEYEESRMIMDATLMRLIEQDKLLSEEKICLMTERAG